MFTTVKLREPCINSLQIGLFGLLAKLDVELVQCFNVIGGEGDWDNDDGAAAALGELGQDLVGLRLKPLPRADLRLPDNAPRV